MGMENGFRSLERRVAAPSIELIRSFESADGVVSMVTTLLDARSAKARHFTTSKRRSHSVNSCETPQLQQKLSSERIFKMVNSAVRSFAGRRA